MGCLCPYLLPQQKNKDRTVTVSGLIIPRDNDGMYVGNPDGQFEIEWTADTEVTLEVNTRRFANLNNGVLHYKVHSSKQTIDFPLPKGPVTAIKTVRRLLIALRDAFFSRATMSLSAWCKPPP